MPPLPWAADNTRTHTQSLGKKNECNGNDVSSQLVFPGFSQPAGLSGPNYEG